MKKFKNMYEYNKFITEVTAQRMNERNPDSLERAMGLCLEERQEELLKAGYDPDEPFIRFQLKSGGCPIINSIIYDDEKNGYRVIDIDYDYVIGKLELYNHLKKNYTQDELEQEYKFDIEQIRKMDRF